MIIETQLPHHNAFLIQEHISLCDKNWFRTGGIARYYAAPISSDDFKQALMFAHMHAMPIFVLGEGANCLISDNGFNGLIIRPQLRTITSAEVSDDIIHVTAGSGVSMEELIHYCLSNHYSGLEEFSGIPGTVGGSIYINLHYFSFLIEHFLVSATVIDATTYTVQTVSPKWFSFGYDYSLLHEKKHFLIDATFSLKKVSEIKAAYAQGRSDEIIRHRHARYPTQNSCGSFFRNFHDHEVSLISNNKKMIYAAYYLDKVGVKGTLQSGNALVSHQHANMIVNKGDATSADIIAVARHMQEMVYERFGIVLQPECQLIGFNTYPLHTVQSLIY